MDECAASNAAATVRAANHRRHRCHQVTWNVSNSQRRDIIYNPSADRFKGICDQTYLRVLPANERQQQRWNANPWQIGDSGDGMLEVDPGAWLLPYWLARFAGILSDADDAA